MGAKKSTKDQEFSDKEVFEVISEDTRKLLKDERARVKKRNTPGGPGYTKKNPKHLLDFRQGCDLLEYSIVIKPYIYKRFNVKSPHELDALLYLYPKQLFTIRDYNMMGLGQHNLFLKTMVELGYLRLAIKSAISRARDIYTLTDHAINIVESYYSYLSGEKVLAVNSYTNPFKNSETKKIDELRERVMLKLKKQAETNSLKFKGKLF